MCVGNQWEVNISLGKDVRIAKQILCHVTGLAPERLNVDLYQDCGNCFEKQGPGKSPKSASREKGLVENLTKQANPDLGIENEACSGLSSPRDEHEGVSHDSCQDSVTKCLIPGRFDLHIGDKMFWCKDGTNLQVTIGSFVTVTDKEGNVCTCAQTSCEGASLGTPCYTYRGGMQLEFGKTKYTFENRDHDGTSYDVMLVEINSNLFTPVPEVMVQMSNGCNMPHRIRKYHGKIHKLQRKHQIKKLSSNLLDSRPDGQVWYPLSGNRRGHYFGLTGVTNHTIPPGKITIKGDCGTLMTSMPEKGSLYAFGSVYGADIRRDRDLNAEVGFTVIFPIREAFDRLKEEYGLLSIDFLGEEPREIGVSLSTEETGVQVCDEVMEGVVESGSTHTQNHSLLESGLGTSLHGSL